MEFVVKCEKCGRTFKNFTARASHFKWIHERPPSPPRYQCNVCSKSFRDSFALKRHVISVHEKGGNARGSFKCTVCECSINKNSASEHFQQHGYNMETETLEFIDSAAFEEWKAKMEKETKSKFVKQHGQRTDKQGVIVNEYFCHRSGNFKSKSKGVRKLKVIGSNKIDSYCPAAILAKSSASGKVTVTFQKTHIGHMNEVSRLWLTKEERAEFASKIALGIPLEEILDELGTGVEGTLSRRDLTTRKDLHNIVQMFNVSNDSVLHSEDCIIVDPWGPDMEENSNFECSSSNSETTVAAPCAEASVIVQQLSDPAWTTLDNCDLEKQKASLVAEVSEIIQSVKSVAGLDAVKRHLAPLQFIINAAEDKASVNFPQVAANTQEPANKLGNPQRKFYLPKKKICVYKIENDQSFML